MADGSLTLKLDERVAARLKEAAAQAGEPAEVFAQRLLASALEADNWAIANARIEEYERTGVAEEASVFFDRVGNRIFGKRADEA